MIFLFPDLSIGLWIFLFPDLLIKALLLEICNENFALSLFFIHNCGRG